MPKLWSDTIEAHRREVRDAILDTTAGLVARHGLRSVTMSQVAEGASIGRATLYKYFPDVEAILVVWHQRQVAMHLGRLAEVRDRAGGAGERLHAVLEAYAFIVHGRRQHGGDLVALVHRDEHVAHGEQQLTTMIRDLLADAAEAGVVRADIGADELAGYCRHALEAAGEMREQAAVRRLVTVTVAGLRPPA